jgi:hypothetical protein
MTAYDEFLEVLRKYRASITSVIGISIALPLAASQVNLTPPWPKGVVLWTAIWQALMIVVTFQFGQRLSRRSANRTILWGGLLVLTCGIMYYAALSQLTFEGGAARERLVKGMVCTEEALLLKPYRDNCPFLNDQLINSAESTERLWTTSSITTSRLLLLSLWLILYTGIAACFALFITFQSQQKSRLRVVANKSQD